MRLALGLGGGGGRRWAAIPGAAVDLDFRNRQYYWGGAQKVQADFTNFTLSGGASHGAAGIVCSGTAADVTVDILTATLGITFPCAMIVKFTPSIINATGRAAVTLSGAALAYAGIGIHTNDGGRVIVVATTTQAQMTNTFMVVDTAYTIGGNFETNNILQTVNGATGAAADTSATLPSISSLIIGKVTGGGSPWQGTVHRVIIVSGAQTQSALNSYAAALHAT